ncbi:MAG: hypothetical protein QM783_07730 [Phycisphaerales bacterium]
MLTPRADLRNQTDFSEARSEDDAEIRRLLREHAMPGAVSVSLEREPSLRAGHELEGGEHRTLVCRDGDKGCIIAVGSGVTRSMWVGGVLTPVAYLTQFRLDHAARGKRRLIVDGYEHMGAMLRTPCTFTSILDDNTQARRLLERGLPGMPTYQYLSPFHTFALGRGKGTSAGSKRVEQLAVSNAAAVASLLTAERGATALAPAWTEHEIARLIRTGTLTLLGLRNDNQLQACVGVWNLSGVKQAVVRGYTRTLSLARGALNMAALALGSPHLPAVGEPLRMRFLSHAALQRCSYADAQMLLGAACGLARSQGASLIGGAAPDHPLHGLLSQHAWNTMRSRIYSVEWPTNPGLPPTPSKWPRSEASVHLEVALL